MLITQRNQLNKLFLDSLTKDYLPFLRDASWGNIRVTLPHGEDTPFKNDIVHLFSASFDFVTLKKDNSVLMETPYIHLGSPQALMCNIFFFVLLLLILEIKSVSSNNQFAIFEEFLDYAFAKVEPCYNFFIFSSHSFIIKELLSSLFSFLSNPNDHYYFGSPKNSVIKDFFDSFFLTNVHKVKLDISSSTDLHSYSPEESFFIPSLKGNLFFLPTDSGLTCSPIILNPKSSFNESLRLSLNLIKKMVILGQTYIYERETMDPNAAKTFP
jgi:hypothetical protein